MKARLSKKRAAWTAQFRRKGVAGSPVAPNAGVEDWYMKELARLTDAMHETALREIEKLFRAEGGNLGYSEDASLSSQARITMNGLRRVFARLFARKAGELADAMIAKASRANAAGVKASLKELSGGLAIKTDFISGKLAETLKAAITENVGLIRSIPQRYLEKVEGAVMRSITTGNGMADLVPELRELGDITVTRARFIARDQCNKANAALTRGRLESAGIRHFQWIHSGRSREPRPLHEWLNGQVFAFDDPPVIDGKTGKKGFPGDLINCKCRMRPYMKFEEAEARP
ncbi:MAG: minor capsid protein [Desulfovibrio sp.]|jgi:SPP1 gp7 family putative phage head morphogenesis protein|nr:minor capsid protein [Desulfovibrio sp.]